LNLRKAAAGDVAAAVLANRSCSSGGNVGTAEAFVYGSTQVSAPPATTTTDGGDGGVPPATTAPSTYIDISIDVVVKTLSADCSGIEQQAQCVAAMLSVCRGYPSVGTSVGGTGNSASCSPVAPSVDISDRSPCGDFGCAAAEDDIRIGTTTTTTTMPPLAAPPDSKLGLIIGATVGGLLLLLLIGFVARRMQINRRGTRGIGFVDGTKYTKGFDLSRAKGDEELRKLANEAGDDVFYSTDSKTILRELRGKSVMESDATSRSRGRSMDIDGDDRSAGLMNDSLVVAPPPPRPPLKEIATRQRGITMTFI
jgi:hypothetical protein